jgi:hypothetical protein
MSAPLGDELLERWADGEAAQMAPAWPSALPQLAVAALEPTLTEWGSSRFGMYRTCQRAHALRYTERLVPLRLGPALSHDYFGLGILIHACLAYAWEGFAKGEQRDWRDVLRAATQRDRGVELDLYNEAERLCAAYWAHHGEPDWDPEHVRIVDVERELCDAESFALPYTARLDLVVSVDDTIHVVDTKSRAKGLPQDRVGYARKLRTRAQFIGQSHLAMRAYGLSSPPPVIVNAIVKTRMPAFARLVVPITQQDVDTWCEQQRIDAAAGLAGRNMNYSSCAPEMGSPCSYLEYCHGSAEQRSRLFGVAETAAPQPLAA